jgi:hypothetical protein
LSFLTTAFSAMAQEDGQTGVYEIESE